MSRPTLHSNRTWSNIRWPTALIGLVLIIYGQIRIASNVVPRGIATQLGIWLTQTIHLSIPSIDNVLYGLPFLLVGGILLTLALRGLRLLPPNETDIQEKPVALHLIRSLWPWGLGGLILFSILLLQLNPVDYRPFLPLLWLIPLCIFAAITLSWDRRRQVNLSPGLSRRDLLWMTGLMIAGLLIGIYRLQGMPDQLMGDEGNFWTIARDIAKGDLKPPLFATGVYSFPILSSIFQAEGLRVFGIDLWGWRISSVLIGLITVLPLYLLARDAFDRRVAVASSIALITSPYFLVFSRLGYNNIQALFITVLALYWLYLGLNRTSSFLLFLAGCTCGLGFYTYFAARGTLVVAFLFTLFMWLLRKIKFRQVAYAYILLSLGAFLVITPHYVYGLHQAAQDLGFKAFESIFFNVFNGRQFYSDAELFRFAPLIHFGGNELFYNPMIYVVLIVRGFIRSMLVFQKPWLVSEHYIAFPLAGTVGAIFYLIGLAITLKTVKQPRSLLIIIWFFINVIGFSTLNTVPPRHTHMVAIIPAIALLIGIGLNAIVYAVTYIHSWLKRHRNFLLAIAIATAGIGGIYDFFVTMPDKYHPQPDQIMSWAGLNSNGESFAYVYSDPSESSFLPYMMAEFRQEVPFETISISDLVNNVQILAGNKKIVIFYPPELEEKIVSIFRVSWGSDLITKTFYSTNGTPVLAASMNTPFIFERDRPFLDTLLDSFRHPSLIILLALLIVFFLLVGFLPILSIRIPSIPPWIKRFADWFNGSDQVPTEDELDETVEEILPAPAIPFFDEPPEWANEFPQSTQQQKPKRLKWEFKSISTDTGKDYYVRIHLPPIHLPWFQLPDGFQISTPAFHAPNVILLIIAIFLAIAAQFLLTRQNFLIGSLLYAISVIGLISWAIINPKWKNVFINQLRISPRAEMLLAISLLFLVSFFHLYDLGSRVYGLEADETKWTVQSWYSTILQIDRGDFATLHYKDLPLDFWVRSIFLRIFGLNFISARIESAFLSILAVFFLYLLVRRLTASPPTALLSSFLYSFSFMELNGSHQALHNTTLEVWMISGFYFLVLGIQQRKWWQFQIAGILIALGMLTYETFFPTAIISLVYILGLAFYEVIKKKWSARKWLQVLLLVIWPIIFVYFEFTKEYLAARQGYHFGWLNRFSGNGASVLGAIDFMLRNIGDLLRTLFSHVTWPDSLINWTGPLINPILLPFVVIGLIYNFWNIRRQYFLLIPIWYLFHTIAAPIILGSVWPRVLYTGLVPIMIWGAMGLWTFLGALRAWFDGLKINIAAPIFMLLIVMIAFNDYRIFTSSLIDPIDRQKRRELSDITEQSAGNVSMILFPYLPNQNDSVALETHVILFSVAGARHIGLNAEQYFQQIEFSQLLQDLWHYRQVDGLDLVFDKTALNLPDQRMEALKVVLNCYPGASVKSSKKFFDVYHFNSQALSQPKCYQSTPPTIITPQDGTVLSVKNPIILEWDTQGTNATSFSLTLEKKSQGNYWIEVEDSFLGPGWYASSQFVNGFSGKGFLLDNWQAEKTQYNFNVPDDGQYQIWIRSLKRRVNDQHNFITINDRRIEFAKGSNQLNDWVWEDLGKFDLGKGQLPITLSRVYGNDEQYSVFIDALLITTNLDRPPDKISIWENILSTGEISPASSSYIIPAQELLAGEYRWKVRIFNADRLIDFQGERGVDSPAVIFTVQP